MSTATALERRRMSVASKSSVSFCHSGDGKTFAPDSAIETMLGYSTATATVPVLGPARVEIHRRLSPVLSYFSKISGEPGAVQAVGYTPAASEREPPPRSPRRRGGRS